ncbi:MAG: DUF4194 domain-containing protein [Oscillatoriales cyanobacterium]|uniref:DUF4194 domain-containing protein n=1 Tax=Microcoleus anatoxicus TaxID=2705319 RepID=UPI0029767BE3|nr:MAG: DUF4194 domain-containing protein [Oscillatoriales cyanobacterium]TAF62621.1 MAG: DUF4194 domain-containing protein [Oscillatoriales cyanobacterium]
MMTNEIIVSDYASAIIKLLQGILYDDDGDWGKLLNNEQNVREYFGKIGLRLYLDEAEGYAYLQQPDGDDGDEKAKTLPRLVKRLPLSYEVTVLCVLLREKLLEFNNSTSDSTRCIVYKHQIHDLMRQFFPEQTDDQKLLKKFDESINRVVKLHFLKELKNTEGESYEIRRILKAKIPAEKLTEIKKGLEAYDRSNV